MPEQPQLICTRTEPSECCSHMDEQDAEWLPNHNGFNAVE